MVMKGPFRYSHKPGLHRARRCPLVRARSLTREKYEYQRRFQGDSQHQTIFNSLTYQSSGTRNQLRYQTRSWPIRCDSEPTYSVEIGSSILRWMCFLHRSSIDRRTVLPRLSSFNMYLQWRKFYHLISLLGLLDGMKQYSSTLSLSAQWGTFTRTLVRTPYPIAMDQSPWVLAPMFSERPFVVAFW